MGKHADIVEMRDRSSDASVPRRRIRGVFDQNYHVSLHWLLADGKVGARLGAMHMKHQRERPARKPLGAQVPLHHASDEKPNDRAEHGEGPRNENKHVVASLLSAKIALSASLLCEKGVSLRRYRNDGARGAVRLRSRHNGECAERDELRLQPIVRPEGKRALQSPVLCGSAFGALEFDEPDKFHFLLYVQMDRGHAVSVLPFCYVSAACRARFFMRFHCATLVCIA